MRRHAKKSDPRTGSELRGYLVAEAADRGLYSDWIDEHVTAAGYRQLSDVPDETVREIVTAAIEHPLLEHALSR